MMEHEELIPGLPEEIAIECLIRVPPFHCYKLGMVHKLWKSVATTPHATHRRSQLQASLSKKNIIPGRREGTFMILLQEEEDHTINDNNDDGNKEETMIEKKARLVLYDIVKRDWWCEPLAGNFPAANLPKCCVISLTGENLVVMGDLTVREPPPQQAWAGRTTGPSVWVYNFSSSINGGWREGTPMPAPPRLLFAHASDGLGTIFVAGGWNPVTDEPLRSAMAYDVEREEWIPLPPMIQKRSYCYGTFFDNKLYIANNSCCCEVLDLTTFSWSLSVPPDQVSNHKELDPETYHQFPEDLHYFPEINTYCSPGLVWLLTKPLTTPHQMCVISKYPKEEGATLLRAKLDHEHSLLRNDGVNKFFIIARPKEVRHILLLPEKYLVSVRGISLTNFLLQILHNNNI